MNLAALYLYNPVKLAMPVSISNAFDGYAQMVQCIGKLKYRADIRVTGNRRSTQNDTTAPCRSPHQLQPATHAKRHDGAIPLPPSPATGDPYRMARWYNTCVRCRDGDGTMRERRPHRAMKGTKMSAKKAVWNTNDAGRASRARGKNATITITNGCFAGLEIALVKERMTLGKGIECDICLDHTNVSNEHAVILKEGNEYVLEDLGSRRGTMLNKKPVRREPLHDGDLISIGAFKLRFSS
jgi:hypothetical protein